MRYLPWHKIDSSKWLNGTIRGGLTRAQRGDWADLIALAATLPVRDGTLRYGAGQPMSRGAIAARLVIEVNDLNETIEACQKDERPDGSPRLKIWEDGTIELANFSEYQAEADGRQKRITAYKEQAKVKAKSRQNSLDALRREVNRLNQNVAEFRKKMRYVERDGKILDTETGVVVPYSEGGE